MSATAAGEVAQVWHCQRNAPCGPTVPGGSGLCAYHRDTGHAAVWTRGPRASDDAIDFDAIEARAEGAYRRGLDDDDALRARILADLAAKEAP